MEASRARPFSGRDTIFRARPFRPSSEWDTIFTARPFSGTDPKAKKKKAPVPGSDFWIKFQIARRPGRVQPAEKLLNIIELSAPDPTSAAGIGSLSGGIAEPTSDAAGGNDPIAFLRTQLQLLQMRIETRATKKIASVEASPARPFSGRDAIFAVTQPVPVVAAAVPGKQPGATSIVAKKPDESKIINKYATCRWHVASKH